MTERYGGDPMERSGKNPVFFEDPVLDRMMAMILTLAEELAVTKEQLDSLHRVMISEGVIGEGAIEKLVTDPAVQAERQQQHQRLVARLLAGVENEMRQD